MLYYPYRITIKAKRENVENQSIKKGSSLIRKSYNKSYELINQQREQRLRNMKARKTSELVNGDFKPMKCDSCDKICEDEGVTEGYFLEPETEDELKQLKKQFPNEQVVFVCEDCLSKFPTLDH
jgi:hypothetical protein